MGLWSWFWPAHPTFIPLAQLLRNLGVVRAAHHADLHPRAKLLQEGSHLGVDFLQQGGEHKIPAVSVAGAPTQPPLRAQNPGEAHVPPGSEALQGLEHRP